MSDEVDNYDEEGFDSQPQPLPSTPPPQLPTSTPSSKPPSRESPSTATPALAFPGPTSPLAVSNQVSSRSSARSVRSSLPVKSPKSSSTNQSSSNKKKAAALLETASNPQLVIAQLQQWNDQLTQQTNSQADLIQSLQSLNSELEASQTHHNQQLHDLTSQLHSLTSQHSTLKQQHTATLVGVAKLEATNVDLLSNAMKEKNQRVELETRLIKCEVALKKERDDCVRLKGERKEREVQAKVEREQWEQEKLAHQSTTSDLLTRLEQLDQQVKHHKTQHADLTHQLTALHHQLTSKDHELSTTHEQLLTAIRRANEHADDALRAHEQVRKLEEVGMERQQTVLELERVVKEQKEVVRGQTDRIHSVVFQMGRMDEWKVVKEQEEREKDAVMQEMRGVVESQEKAMNTALISKERSDSMIGILEERLGKEGKKMQDMRDKHTEMERQMKGVVASLREKESEYDHLTIKLSHVTSKWAQEQQLRGQEKRAADMVERKWLEQRAELDGLMLERQRLEDEKVVREERMREQQQQLEQLNKKDEHYRKIQDMLASSNTQHSQSLLALLTSNNEKYVHYTNPVMKGKLKVALLGGQGQRVKAMLKRCEVDPRQLLDWCIEPQRLVDGLYELLVQVKQLRNVEAFGGRRGGGGEREEARRGEEKEDGVTRDEYEREVELMSTRNAQLNQSIIKAEADKSKAVMRLVTLCTGHTPEPLPPPISSDPTFITEAEPVDTEQGRSPSGGEQLVLSEMGLTDGHVQLIAPQLARCGTVREIDLRGNGLTNPSAVALISACVEEGNRVHMIDLQQNLITLDGLEEVAMMLMKRTKQSQGGEEKESAGRIHSASLYRQGPVLLPILQLRLVDKLLLVDFRYNRLQHLKSGAGGVAPSGGESVKQTMKRVLLRVCRLLNTVGHGANESIDQVDWDTRTTWMTEQEVQDRVRVNQEKKERNDRLKEKVSVTFDTQYERGQVRRASELEVKNVNVRPVLPGPVKKRASAVSASGGLPRIGSAGERDGSKKGSRRDSGVAKREEEQKVQEEEERQLVVIEKEVERALSAEQVEGAVDATDDEYGEDDFAERDNGAQAVSAE